MPHTTICPGWHNDRYRLAVVMDEQPDVYPVDGEPVWCSGCYEHTRTRLLAAPWGAGRLAVQIERATRASAERVSGSRSWRMHDAQTYTLPLDDLRDLLTQWEDDIRDRRGLSGRRRDVRQGPAITASATFLLAHLEWALQYDPDAGEAPLYDFNDSGEVIRSYHGATRLFVDRFARLDRRITHLTSQDEPQEIPCDGVVCPNSECDAKALVYTLEADGSLSGAVRCLACHHTLTEEQYQRWTGQLAAYERSRIAAGAAA